MRICSFSEAHFLVVLLSLLDALCQVAKSDTQLCDFVFNWCCIFKCYSIFWGKSFELGELGKHYR